MRLTISRQELAGLVARGTSTAPKTSVAPIVTHARLRARNGTIYVASTDFDKVVEAAGNAIVEMPGALTVDADKLKTTVDRLKGDEVSLTVDGNRDLVLKCGRSRVRFATLAAEDWPSWDWKVDGARFEIAGAQLSRLLTNPLTPAGIAPPGMIYSAIFLHTGDWDQGEPALLSAGTNGHILFVTAIGRPEGAEAMPENGGRPGALLSVDTARLALKLFGGGDDKVLIEVAQNKVVFEKQGTRLASKLVDGTFPEYSRAIPDDSETFLQLDRERALASVALIETFITKDQGHKLQCAGSDEGFVMAAGDRADGDATDIADAEITGSVKPFGLSSQYLKIMLNAFRAETVRLDYHDPTKPLRVSSSTELDMIGVLSTMRINTNLVSEPAHEQA
jgi:DNA polymerase-3 subunit beta